MHSLVLYAFIYAKGEGIDKTHDASKRIIKWKRDLGNGVGKRE